MHLYLAQAKLVEFKELVKLEANYLTTRHKLEVEVSSPKQLVTSNNQACSSSRSNGDRTSLIQKYTGQTLVIDHER